MPAPTNLHRSRTLIGVLVFGAVLFLSWRAGRHRVDEVLHHKSDPWGYYQYLPALLSTHDWAYLPYAHELDNGRHLNLFTCGVAWMQLPFFLGASVVAKLTGAAQDGYSPPFVLAQWAASACYLATGVLLLLLSLERWVTRSTALFSVAALILGTNLYYYSIHETGMSHVYAFFLLAAMVHLTVRMNERPSGGALVLLLAVCGLVVLVRQLNAVALLFPLLYGKPVREALKDRLSWVRQHPAATTLGGIAVILFWMPQLLYWKHVTGQWLVFTYGKKGEGFDWLHPHLLDVLASHQNGWFIYTPVMLGVMAVLVWHAWKGTTGARLILAIWALVWYTYASWWCWWLGGSFGHRGFVEYYAMLALPLAWGLQALFQRPRWIQEVVFVGLALLVFLNVRMSRIYQWPWEGPDWTWGKLAENYLRALLG